MIDNNQNNHQTNKDDTSSIVYIIPKKIACSDNELSKEKHDIMVLIDRGCL